LTVSFCLEIWHSLFFIVCQIEINNRRNKQKYSIFSWLFILGLILSISYYWRKKVVCVFIRFRRHTSMIGEIRWNTPETKSVFWSELIVVYRHNIFELRVYGKLLLNTVVKLCWWGVLFIIIFSIVISEK
jgi:hypothetical protein